MANYNWSEIDRRRAADETWPEIAEDYDVTPGTIRKANSRRKGTAKDSSNGASPPKQTDPVLLTRDDIARIASLDDLLDFFEVDTEAWAVESFRVNKWEQAAGAGDDVTITPLYQVRANLRRNLERDRRLAQEALEAVVEDMQEYAPAYDPLPAPDAGDDPVMLEIALMDPHLGMLAWGQETGEDYDLEIALETYGRVAEDMLAHAELYDVERILFLVGNDMLHVDTIQDKVATTTRGTPQDFDSRIAKLFTAARRAGVAAIDRAREIAPVDVMVVPGNHDNETMYKLGDVYHAWYRNDDRVNVINTPRQRKYLQYGENGFSFTHGDGPKRLQKQLPLIFADEAPGIWSRTTHREVHCGHFHGAGEKHYMSPSTDLHENRGVRVRCLPGLTPADAWHVEQGFRHQRAATVLAWKKSGGLAGLHECYPQEAE